MTFNQQLIEKARKGEIAILNDGTKEQLCEVLSVCCPQYQGNPSGTSYVYEVRYGGWYAIGVPNESSLPAHSVKDFFMTDIKDKAIEELKSDLEWMEKNMQQPRTYRVTRQQMKEIWEALKEPHKDEFYEYMKKHFPMFEDQKEVDEFWIYGLLQLHSDKIIETLAKKFWPSHFYIPEGEPVLYKCDKHAPYRIGVSNGNGHVFLDHQTTGLTLTVHCVIPFTKNPQS